MMAIERMRIVSVRTRSVDFVLSEPLADLTVVISFRLSSESTSVFMNCEIVRNAFA